MKSSLEDSSCKRMYLGYIISMSPLNCNYIMIRDYQWTISLKGLKHLLQKISTSKNKQKEKH